ncbi:hypothetical protein [uncultured Mailhella sp.]|uniref:biotin--[acetyl-CoA-carboxylase] ligase n=1 Tax=uncultured Mailhella sp. TaxID=1981031 RepID=UPI0025FE6512|nr:hypothetical protein [uncultured Mailhella sp.]
MNESAVVRLLFEGLPPIGAQAPTAMPFSPAELAASPLALPEETPSPENAPGADETPGAGRALDADRASDAAPFPTFAETGADAGHAASCGWTAREKNGVRWLERPVAGLPGPVYLTGAATSSLDAARLLVEADLFPEWASVLCLSQSAGRGQMRRAWSSPAGNLYTALRLPMKPPFDSEAAAPACGALMAEALSREGCPVMLKWPNDLLQAAPTFRPGIMPGREDCRKVGGMLMEERRGALIAGTGFNITSCPPSSTLRDNYAFSAGVLCRANGGELASSLPKIRNGEEIGKKNKDIVTIFTLWTHLASSIFSCYSQEQTLEPWWPALAQRHLAFRGCRVTLADACPERETMVRIPCEGVVDGVTASGALRLSTAYGTATFLGGSLLPRGDGKKSLSEDAPSSE